MSSPDRFAVLRRVLVTVGVLVWAPYLLAKYAMHSPFPVGWVLVIHIPCMVGALVLRLLRTRPEGFGAVREPEGQGRSDDAAGHP